MQIIIDESYKKGLECDDLLKATHEAKDESMKLLDDQGLANISVVVAEVLYAVSKNPTKVIEKLSSLGI